MTGCPEPYQVRPQPSPWLQQCSVRQPDLSSVANQPSCLLVPWPFQPAGLRACSAEPRSPSGQQRLPEPVRDGRQRRLQRGDARVQVHGHQVGRLGLRGHAHVDRPRHHRHGTHAGEREPCRRVVTADWGDTPCGGRHQALVNQQPSAAPLRMPVIPPAATPLLIGSHTPWPPD